jgi:hypothetical protein
MQIYHDHLAETSLREGFHSHGPGVKISGNRVARTSPEVRDEFESKTTHDDRGSVLEIKQVVDAHLLILIFLKTLLVFLLLLLFDRL